MSLSNSSVQCFIKDDDGYLRWIEDNPTGFVINTNQPPNRNYLILHRATCGHIHSSERGNWTTDKYMKTCSLHIWQLERWATETTGGAMTLCGACLPTKGVATPSGSFTDALRGYAYDIHTRDNFVCQYCGLDGTASFDNWIRLSWDHLLPKGHPDRDLPDFIVTACMFCNTADNRYFDQAEKRGLQFHGLSREELIEQRRPYVLRVRAAYCKFWTEGVAPKPSDT